MGQSIDRQTVEECFRSRSEKPVDAVAREAKLRPLSSQHLPPPSSPISSCHTRVLESECEAGKVSESENSAYQALLGDDSVSTCDIDHAREIIDEMNRFWKSEAGPAVCFRDQLGVWSDFRELQEDIRKGDLDWTSYEREVFRILEDAGDVGKLRLRQDRKLQSRLEDWCEFRHFCHERLKYLVSDLVAAEQEFVQAQSELHSTRPGAGEVPPRVGGPSWAYTEEAEGKRKDNEGEIETANQRLEQLAYAEQRQTRRKAALLKDAQERLDESQKVLNLLFRLSGARRRFRTAQRDEKGWSTFGKSNYAVWLPACEMELRAQECYGAVSRPPVVDPHTLNTLERAARIADWLATRETRPKEGFSEDVLMANYGQWRALEDAKFEKWEDLNSKAQSVIYNLCANHVKPLIVHEKTARDILAKLKQAYEQQGLAAIYQQTILVNSYSLKQFNTLEEYVNKLRSNRSSFDALRHQFNDDFWVSVFLNGLGEDYELVVSQILDTPANTVAFDDAVQKVFRHDMRKVTQTTGNGQSNQANAFKAQGQAKAKTGNKQNKNANNNNGQNKNKDSEKWECHFV
ncbi:hypothetical protein AYL99_11206 [Fonsecaea erecta]|uniref:Uncharacterized protein n=1 Tax=Fonsecaea erecta TaxID=1367422 RepID=A0A178Z4S1_9EURO|nr:hypothetical protein AYL99_11206 [Fonsecaea erecta]OAP54758.1 hypothetical protein AYL99_11206 [Fonsecaea erecta]